MQTITFYSYNGGTGRTLTVANAAKHLVRLGQKVFAIDLDLEAPGLETFAHLRPPKPHPGIVEFVTEYERTMCAPDVREYIYEAAAVGKKGGFRKVASARLAATQGNFAVSVSLAAGTWQIKVTFADPRQVVAASSRTVKVTIGAPRISIDSSSGGESQVSEFPSSSRWSMGSSGPSPPSP